MAKRILVVTGTRAEYGLLRSTMDAISAHPDLELKLLVTGMHTLPTYGFTQDEIARDGYHIDCIVPIAEGSDMLESFGQEITGIRSHCLRERPDCILVLGDRDEPFAAAIVAGHLNIALAHIHGGDVTGPTVDESIRHSITKFAHLHFPGTKKSAERIMRLAEDSSRIFCVGTPVIDILMRNPFLPRQEVAKALALDASRPWLTVLQHPTPLDTTPLHKQIGAVLEAIGSFPEQEKIIIYPNNDTGSTGFIEKIRECTGSRIHIFPSLSRHIFMSSVKESDALVGNSSAGIIETAYLGTPTVNVGNRQHGRERGESVVDTEYDPSQIADAVRHAAQMKAGHNGLPFASPYGVPGAGVRIAETLARELYRPDLLRKIFVDTDLAHFA